MFILVKILSIGNSFSEDAHKYIKEIADNANVETKVVNLMIGGCSLERHAKNINENLKDYHYQLYCQYTGEVVTCESVISEDNWDIVTIQQVSNFSGKFDTFEPYIATVLDFVKKHLPNAEIYLQKTWAYEIDSTHPAFELYNKSQEQMYNDIVNTYDMCSKKYNLPVIPTGDVIQTLRSIPFFDYKNGGTSLNRDGFHLSLDYGRYAASAAWCETLLGIDVTKTTFKPEGTDQKVIEEIRNVVHKICNK